MEKVSKINGKLTLRTKEGCARLLVIFLVGIVAFSFFGKLIQSDFGTVRVQHVLIDVRGAVLDGQLYYPNGTSSKDKLPAVVIAHGGGMNYGAMRGSATEIARRGFVVLSLSAYGSSLSPMPPYDETGNGVEEFNLRGDKGASAGLFDAVDYVRSMACVDPTRVGLLGQSMGANRAGAAAVIDCGYLSFNDIMINVLYDTFNQKFTEEEITQDAEQLALARLNNDELMLYNSLRDTNWEHFNTRLKAVMVVGLNWLPPLSPSAEVEVAGYAVTRNVQTNVGYGTGTIDVWRTINTDDVIKSTWYSPQDITYGSWYSIDDVNKSNKVLGDFSRLSIVDSDDMRTAIQNKTARVLCEPVKNVTHTGICLSAGLYSQQAKFFEQTLGYNRGNLGDPGTHPLDTSNTFGLWREICNGLAMLSMFGMVIALACLLLKTKAFSTCVVEMPEGATRPPVNKKRYWIMGALTVVVTFAAIFYTNKGLNGFWLAEKFLSPIFPFGQGTLLAFAFLLFIAVGTLLVMAINVYINKKENGNTGLKALNIGIKFKTIMKTIGLALIVLTAAYAALSFINYFFGQDFRYFTTYFSYVKPDYWFRLIPTMLVFFVIYLLIGVSVNYTVREDISGWRDTLNTVVLYSLGIWLLCLINELLAIHAGAVNPLTSPITLLANFMNTYHFNVIVPLVACISRIMYKQTNSIWLGAAVAALLVAWAATGSGANDMYISQNWLSNFLG